jgi:hypothetical protein
MGNMQSLTRSPAGVDSRRVYHPPRNAKPRCELAAEPVAADLAHRWQAFVVAKARAEHTGDIRDGIKAARAWRAFLDLFLSNRPPF